MMVDRVAHSTSLLLVLLVALGMSHASVLEASGTTGPAAREINTNLEGYPNGQVPRYEKLELTFEVDTLAQNPQLPRDAAPPPWVEPEIGVSLDALFTFDDWQTVDTQPALYYHEFDDQAKSGQQWFYPTGNFSCKVRFAPHQAGTWQFKLRAQDFRGIYDTGPQSSTVVSSNNKGFVRVSQTDSRYFEHEDGTYFPALGCSMNCDHVSWRNPVLDDEQDFATMSDSGLQLVRIWLSQWAIYGPSWNPWDSVDPDQRGLHIPQIGLTFEQASPGSEVSMRLTPPTIGVCSLGPGTRSRRFRDTQAVASAFSTRRPVLSAHR